MFRGNRRLTLLVLMLCVCFVPYLAFSAEKKAVSYTH